MAAVVGRPDPHGIGGVVGRSLDPQGWSQASSSTGQLDSKGGCDPSWLSALPSGHPDRNLRLLAIVPSQHPCMPDVATDLSACLKADFKWHVSINALN